MTFKKLKIQYPDLYKTFNDLVGNNSESFRLNPDAKVPPANFQEFNDICKKLNPYTRYTLSEDIAQVMMGETEDMKADGIDVKKYIKMIKTTPNIKKFNEYFDEFFENMGSYCI